MFRHAIVAVAVVGLLALTGQASASFAPTPLDGLTLTVPAPAHGLLTTTLGANCASPTVLTMLRGASLNGTAVQAGSGWSAVPGDILDELDVDTVGGQIVELNLRMKLVNGSQQRLLMIDVGSDKSCVPLGAVSAKWSALPVPLLSPDPDWTGSAHLNVPAPGGTLTVTLDRQMSAPVWTSEPQLHGQPVVGQQMSVSASPPSGAAVDYQWQHSRNGTTWSNIGGATAQAYTVDVRDVGFRLRAVVTVQNAVGEAAATTGQSAVVTIPVTGDYTSFTADLKTRLAVHNPGAYKLLFTILMGPFAPAQLNSLNTTLSIVFDSTNKPFNYACLANYLLSYTRSIKDNHALIVAAQQTMDRAFKVLTRELDAFTANTVTYIYNYLSGYWWHALQDLALEAHTTTEISMVAGWKC